MRAVARVLLLLLAMFAVGFAIGVRPSERPMLIDPSTGSGQARLHRAGGEWCDVNHPDPPPPVVRGPMAPRRPGQADQRSIA